MYRIITTNGAFHEVCDECGFHGGTLDLADTVAGIRALPDRWAELLAHDEALVRARPEPDTYCAVEYAQHVVDAIAEIELAARVYADGRPLDWAEIDEHSVPGVFDHPTHECERFSITDTIDTLRVVAESMAAFTESLTPEQQRFVTLYGGDWMLDTTAVVRHALHDAEHHVLDVRRGFARLLLRD